MKTLTTPALPASIRIVEVGPRDGLQNEKQILSAAVKSQLVDDLAATGLTTIEAGSFVSPKWVPAMANSDEVFRLINRQNNVTYTGLVPNLRGLETALACGVEEVAVFVAATETFSQRNVNCSIAESMSKTKAVVDAALAEGLRVRGYLSCVVGCPYEGEVSALAVAQLSEQLISWGCYEVSLGDTIGIGTPLKMQALLGQVIARVPVSQVAVHLHDTYGFALANVFTAFTYGVSVVDASVAGLGGCPYAQGASGNVATEDVVHFCQQLGITTQVDLQKLIAVGNSISATLGRSNPARIAKVCG